MSQPITSQPMSIPKINFNPIKNKSVTQIY